MLDTLLHKYSSSIHCTTGMTPVQASQKENEVQVLQYIINKTSAGAPLTKPKYRVGNKVRISRMKMILEKGYLLNCSEELYIVDIVQNTTSVTYKLKDTLGEEVEGSFYKQELQKSNQEVYRVEKVIRKKKINGIEHGLVKWSGYSEKHNQRIPSNELKKLI